MILMQDTPCVTPASGEHHDYDEDEFPDYNQGNEVMMILHQESPAQGVSHMQTEDHRQECPGGETGQVSLWKLIMMVTKSTES